MQRAGNAEVQDGLAGIRDAIEDRLGQVQAAADDASRLVRNLTFIFLLVGLYIFIIGAGTDDETLFRDGDVHMPLLNVGVPVSSFYFLVPPLFLLLHFNLLLQYYFLSRKLHALNAVRNQLLHGDAAREEHRGLLFPLPFGQLVAGRAHGAAVDLLLRIMVWVILAGLPVTLLLWLQRRFLPYQDPWIVAVHRIVVALDLVLIWAVYPRLTRPSGDWWGWFEGRYPWLARTLRDPARWRQRASLRRLWRRADPKTWSFRLPVWRWRRDHHKSQPGPPRPQFSWRHGLLDGPAVASAAVLFLSYVVAVHPYGPVERFTPFLDWPRGWLLDQGGSYLHRTLNVQDKILVAEAPPAELLALYVGDGVPGDLIAAEAAAPSDTDDTDDATARRARRNEAFREHATALNLEGRSFRNARLSGVEVFDALLAGADLQGASLAGADLQGADLRQAGLWPVVFAAEDVAGLAAETGWPEEYIRDVFGEGLVAARLELADLRGARIGPMTEEEVAALIARVEEEVGYEAVRERIAGRLRKRLGEAGEQASGLELPPALTSAVPVLVRLDDGGSDGADGAPDLTDLLGEPMAPEAYERALGEHLAGLACGEESNRYVAKGVAWRGFNDAGETVARVLAAALLDDGCKGYAAYLATRSEEDREERRRELERVAAPADDAADGGG